MEDHYYCNPNLRETRDTVHIPGLGGLGDPCVGSGRPVGSSYNGRVLQCFKYPMPEVNFL